MICGESRGHCLILVAQRSQSGHSSPHFVPQLPPSTSNNDGVPWLNGHHPDANYLGTYHGPTTLFTDSTATTRIVTICGLKAHHLRLTHQTTESEIVFRRFQSRGRLLHERSESVSSRMSAMEGLKRLADRYLQDPGSHVDTLSMG
ncbi:hypothetical protein EDB84DRAFT_1437299, partial [Lactarius hengduanensis]